MKKTQDSVDMTLDQTTRYCYYNSQPLCAAKSTVQQRIAAARGRQARAETHEKIDEAEIKGERDFYENHQAQRLRSGF